MCVSVCVHKPVCLKAQENFIEHLGWKTFPADTRDPARFDSDSVRSVFGYILRPCSHSHRRTHHLPEGSCPFSGLWCEHFMGHGCLAHAGAWHRLSALALHVHWALEPLSSDRPAGRALCAFPAPCTALAQSVCPLTEGDCTGLLACAAENPLGPPCPGHATDENAGGTWPALEHSPDAGVWGSGDPVLGHRHCACVCGDRTVREGRCQRVSTSSSTCGNMCGLAASSRPPWTQSRGSCVPAGALCVGRSSPRASGSRRPLQTDSSWLAVPSPDAACSRAHEGCAGPRGGSQVGASWWELWSQPQSGSAPCGQCILS